MPLANINMVMCIKIKTAKFLFVLIPKGVLCFANAILAGNNCNAVYCNRCLAIIGQNIGNFGKDFANYERNIGNCEYGVANLKRKDVRFSNLEAEGRAHLCSVYIWPLVPLAKVRSTTWSIRGNVLVRTCHQELCWQSCRLFSLFRLR